jgi:hypothetical protein
MANVSSRTANWRLFGGGGLIVGGLLWTLHFVLVQAGILALGPWLAVIALLVIAVALALVAFGETGSNGAVGKDLLGRVALVVYGVGFLLIAVNFASALGSVVVTIAALLVIIGGLLSAYAIYQKRVAKGAARWFLFLPAVIGALWALGIAFVAALQLWWLGLLLALLLAIAGALYLFNSRKLG